MVCPGYWLLQSYKWVACMPSVMHLSSLWAILQRSLGEVSCFESHVCLSREPYVLVKCLEWRAPWQRGVMSLITITDLI